MVLRQMLPVLTHSQIKALPPVLCPVGKASQLDGRGESGPRAGGDHTSDKGLSHPMMGRGGQGPVQWSRSAP